MIRTSLASLESLPSDIMELLGPPPLLATEDASLYFRIVASFAESIRPEDLITWMLIKDLADHRVEIARYRRIKVGLITAARRKQVQGEVSGWSHPDTSVLHMVARGQRELVEKAKKSPEETARLLKEIDDKLEADIATLKAEGQVQVDAWRKAPTTEANLVDLFPRWIKNLEQIDILLEAAEKRFTESLEEVDRHLRGLGRYCREELDKIIEGEVVESQGNDEESEKKALEMKTVYGDAQAETASTMLPAQNIARPRARIAGDSKPHPRARRSLSGSQ
jgi:hypothetical protein